MNDAKPASGDGLLATRDAWFAVCDALDQVDPDWMMHGPVGVEAAVATIRRLATSEQPEIAGVRDTLIVAANNPVSHGGLNGLQQIMRAQAERLRNIEQPSSAVQWEAVAEIAGSDTVLGRESRFVQWEPGVDPFKFPLGGKLYLHQPTPPPAPAAEHGWGPSYKQPWQAKEDATQPEACMTEGDKITAQNEAFDIAESMNVEACSPGEAAPPPNTPAQHYLAEHNGCASQDWQDGFNACARGQPEGKWKKVPVEPTEAMLANFWAVANGQHPMDERSWALTKRQLRRATAAYRRMLAAAPAAPGVRVDEAMANRFMRFFNCEAESTTGTRLYTTEQANVLNALTAALAPDGGEEESNAS